jgi:Fe-S-cluster containining protein
MYSMPDSALLILFAFAFLAVAVNARSWRRSMGLYQRRRDFRCRMCGNCCRFRVTPLRAEDVRRLEQAGYRDFTAEKGELSLRRVNGRCVFLEGDSCTVYEVRPQVCREFPFFKVYGVGYAQSFSICPALEELDDG